MTSRLKVPAHEATTAQLGSAYPFVGAPRLRAGRVLVGRDLAGGAFLHDPFALYAAGELTNPNMVVLGRIGRGKSALVKTYLRRQAAFGRQIAVLDPKGEYGPLADALGCEPLRLSPDGGTRVNPLESATPGGSSPAADRPRRLGLLAALAEASLHRRLLPTEHLALEVALDSSAARLSTPTLGAVVEALLAPEPATGAGWLGDLDEAGRDVGLQLRRLVRGDLAGMFDGTTTAAGPDEFGRALVVDLSDVYHSEALPVLMVCAAAWLQSMTERAGAHTLLVLDEAWAVLGDLTVGRWLRASWKLARAKGVANVAVCHRVSDLSASGADGSESSRLAEGLLADSETLICYSQPPSELPALAAWLGCSEDELAVLPTLRRGIALWRVGGASYLVEHLLGRDDIDLVDTDDRLRERA